MNKKTLSVVLGGLLSLGAVTHAWAATPATSEFAVSGEIQTDTCTVSDVAAAFGVVTSEAVQNGTAAKSVTVQVSCDGKDATPTSLTFGTTALESDGDNTLFALQRDDDLGVTEAKLDTAVKLTVDGTQTALWGANATDGHQIAPGADLLAGGGGTIAKIAAGTTEDLNLKVALVPGYVGVGKEVAEGHDIQQAIAVSLVY